MKNSLKIKAYDPNHTEYFTSNATVYCSLCGAHGPYEVTAENGGFACHCYSFLRTGKQGFSFDDNHLNGDLSSMFLFCKGRGAKTTDIVRRDGMFVRYEQMVPSEYLAVVEKLEKDWLTENSAAMKEEYCAKIEADKADSRENGWEKDARKLYDAAMRSYRPEHKYLIVGDIELDASVVRAAELLKEATGVQLVTLGDVVDRGAKYPWNTDGEYVARTLMRIADHFLVGTHEAAFFLRAMDEIREDGVVSDWTFQMYFNWHAIGWGYSNGGYVTAQELLGVYSYPNGLEASEWMVNATWKERVEHALRKPGNLFAEFGDWMREKGKVSTILETHDGKKFLAVHGWVPVTREGLPYSPFKELSGLELLAALENWLRGRDWDAYAALTRDTMPKWIYEGRPKKMNPVWFLSRFYKKLGPAKWKNLLLVLGIDGMVVGHDDETPYSSYDGTLYGLDQLGREKKASRNSWWAEYDKSEIFLFL